ncbi:MAG: phosphatidate cytidylyltransferase [Dethiobacteria bacterium]
MLKMRVLTGIVGIPLLLFLVYMGGYWFGLIVLLISLIGLKEYYSLAHQTGWKALEFTGVFFLLPALLLVYKGNLTYILLLWLLFFIILSLFPVFFYSRVKYKEPAVVFWGVLYTGGLASFLVAIRLLPDGYLLTIFFLALIWSTDICAYFVGTYFGKMPLAPKISPKKTIEGTIGGLVGSVLTGMLLARFLPLPYLQVTTGAALGLIIGVVGALGDLTQSVLKRSANVKNSGNLLPGHGGILDRFDSLLFAAPFFYFLLLFLTG